MEKRRVTMGSQQIRAVNLIHALATKYYQDRLQSTGANPGWKQTVRIIGGSAGGLTAAAYAAFRGADVTIVEKEADWMHNLLCSERFLHPRLYEWGSPQPFKVNDTAEYWRGDEVGTPLLNWGAGKACEVRKKLLVEWSAWARLYDIKTHLGCAVPPHPKSDWDHDDHLILAVGFGQERTVLRQNWPDWVDGAAGSYWQPDILVQRTGNILIYGNGDGALTDLFRACLHGFDQDRLVALLETTLDQNRDLEKRVREIEINLESAGDRNKAEGEMARAYRKMEARELDEWTASKLRDDVRVQLSVLEQPGRTLEESAFTRKAFPLNRLLLASVLRVQKFSHPRVCIILSKDKSGVLPSVVPGNGKHYLVFRMGSGVNPAEKLLPGAKEELAALERLNQDKSKGDITRQPMWPFFGEAVDPQKMPSEQTLIRSLPRTRDRNFIECFRGIDEFVVFADAFDSVFQSAARQALDGAEADAYFIGIMRLFMLAFDRILLTDAQVWDGRFMLGLPKIWNTFAPEEQILIQKKFELRERRHTTFVNTRDGFYLMSSAGRFKAREFDSSYLGKEFSADYSAWLKHGVYLSAPYKSAEALLREFALAATKYTDTIEELIESWNKLDAVCADIFTRAQWPNPQHTRFWNVGLQFENPGIFYAALGQEARDIFSEAFCLQRVSAQRSPVNVFLNEKRGVLSDDSPLREEIDRTSDWFDRAYNRMTAKNQGANVFSALILGDTDHAVSEHRNHISIVQLGRLDSSEFMNLYEKWQKTKSALDDMKPITERYWGKLFDEIEKASANVESPAAVNVDPKDRVARKMETFSSIDGFRVGWVGDLEEGQPGEGPAVCMSTQSIGNEGKTILDQSQTETFRQKAYTS
jgi:hypothetical protein